MRSQRQQHPRKPLQSATSDQTTQSQFVNSAVINTPASSNSAISSAPSSPTATIQSAPFTQRTIIEQAPEGTPNFVTPNQFDTLANRLNNLTGLVGNLLSLLPTLSQNQNGVPTPQQIAGDGNPEAIGAGAAINTLSNVTIANPSITGLSASDIPDLSGSYLSLGGGTLAGAFADSGTASSSFTGALGIGTTSPSDVLAVNGPIYLANVTPSATTNRLYSNAGSLYWNGSALAVGGGGASTTTPNTWTVLQQFSSASSSRLSVYGPVYFAATATSSELLPVPRTPS
jgi:hypothetical protein